MMFSSLYSMSYDQCDLLAVYLYVLPRTTFEDKALYHFQSYGHDAFNKVIYCR